MKKFPLVSIMIVNFNGRHLLTECLPSLFALNYPQDKIEILVIDNNSKDDSVVFIKKKFPTVKLIEAQSNLGFTGGNNLGLEHAQGEYVVMLNSDTVVDSEWLIELVQGAQSDKKIGIVTSKLLFAVPFVRVELESTIVPLSEIDQGTNFSPMGILIEEIVPLESQNEGLVWYESGVYPPEKENKNLSWTKGKATFLLPLSKEVNHFSFTVHGLPIVSDKTTSFTIKCGKNVLIEKEIKANSVKQIRLELDRKMMKKDLIYLIQNAGNILLRSGYGKDRGSILRLSKTEQKEFYDVDTNAYKTPQLVAAACGASCLIKREVIDHVGFLDGRYFMYYEDVDFSLRAWKVGWDILYQPSSIVYHTHRASTGKNESSFFINMVERNHLAFVLTHYPFHVCMNQLLEFFARTAMTILKAELFRFKDNLPRFHVWKEKESGRFQALLFIIKFFPHIMYNRWFWNTRAVRSFDELKPFLY